jgi:hypothetical protein
MVQVKKEEKQVKILLTEGSIDRSEEKTPQGVKKVGTLNKPDTKLAQTVIAKAKRYKELDAQIKLMKKEMDEIKDFFMVELKDKQLDFLFADIYKICYSKSESLGFNAKEFEKKFQDLYNEYKTKLTVSEKLVINMGE